MTGRWWRSAPYIATEHCWVSLFACEADTYYPTRRLADVSKDGQWSTFREHGKADDVETAQRCVEDALRARGVVFEEA